MQFSPRLDQTTLPSLGASRKQFYGIDLEGHDIVLFVGMEVRRMVRGSDLDMQANDNAEAPTGLGAFASCRCMRDLESSERLVDEG